MCFIKYIVQLTQLVPGNPAIKSVMNPEHPLLSGK